MVVGKKNLDGHESVHPNWQIMSQWSTEELRTNKVTLDILARETKMSWETYSKTK